jgi:Ca-activated chloride channel family protein
MIGFTNPAVLACLLLLPVIVLARRNHLRRASVPYPPLQYRTAPMWRAGLDRIRLPLEITLWGLVVLALAGPYREQKIELLDDPGIDVLLVLDVSLSMLAEDFPPNRITVLAQTARDFLARSASHRVGLVIFAGEAYVQCPLTTDRTVLEELLSGVTVYTINQTSSGGTAIGDALLVAVDRLKKSRLPEEDGKRRAQAIVLITDGASNLGIEPRLGARYAKEENMRLYIIGIGGELPMEVFFEGERVGDENDPYLAVLDDAQLQEIAAAGDGRYFRALDANALDGVFAELSRLESSPLEAREVKIRRSTTRWLALLVLPFFVFHVVLNGLVLRRPLR